MGNAEAWNNVKSFCHQNNKTKMQNSCGKPLLYIKISLFMYFGIHILNRMQTKLTK